MKREAQDPFESSDLEEVRQYSQLSSAFWGKAFSGLTAVAYRDRGEAFVNDLWYDVLTSHQDDRYVEGLKRLGIEGDPPAVAAAKYHYFTNIIGGLEMEYVEETPQKVWIRYRAPMWTYAGTALLAMPASVRRTIFSAWHPRNGELMGAPELGYVGTKFVMEGDPYDEGYFRAYERPLGPHEVMRYETVTSTPEFDPETAPRLDPDLWPEVRMLKARPKFSSRYTQSTVDSLYRRLGAFRSHHLVASMMRMNAVQYTPELLARAQVSGTSLESVVRLNTELLRSWRRAFDVQWVSDHVVRFRVARGEPFGDGYSPDLLRALFEFQSMSARMLNGHIRATWRGHDEGEEWMFEDTGHWLW